MTCEPTRHLGVLRVALVTSRDLSVSSAALAIALRCDASHSIMVRIEEVQDETEKIRQQGLDLADENEDDEWEATDAESDDVCWNREANR